MIFRVPSRQFYDSVIPLWNKSTGLGFFSGMDSTQFCEMLPGQSPALVDILYLTMIRYQESSEEDSQVGVPYSKDH